MVLLQAQSSGFGVPEIIIFAVIGLVCVAGVILVIIKARGKRNVIGQPASGAAATRVPDPQASRMQGNIKRCPTCESTYTDETLSYCLVDGAPLEGALPPAAPYDPGATIKITDKGDSRIAPTVQYNPDPKGDEDKVQGY